MVHTESLGEQIQPLISLKEAKVKAYTYVYEHPLFDKHLDDDIVKVIEFRVARLLKLKIDGYYFSVIESRLIESTIPDEEPQYDSYIHKLFVSHKGIMDNTHRKLKLKHAPFSIRWKRLSMILACYNFKMPLQRRKRRSKMLRIW